MGGLFRGRWSCAQNIQQLVHCPLLSSCLEDEVSVRRRLRLALAWGAGRVGVQRTMGAFRAPAGGPDSEAARRGSRGVALYLALAYRTWWKSQCQLTGSRALGASACSVSLFPPNHLSFPLFLFFSPLLSPSLDLSPHL